MDTLSFIEWFKIVGTIVGFFIGYTKWILVSQEKMQKEWKHDKQELMAMIKAKIDNDVYAIQIKQIDKQLLSLEIKMDKLTDMLQKLSVDMATHIQEEKEARHS